MGRWVLVLRLRRGSRGPLFPCRPIAGCGGGGAAAGHLGHAAGTGLAEGGAVSQEGCYAIRAELECAISALNVSFTQHFEYIASESDSHLPSAVGSVLGTESILYSAL